MAISHAVRKEHMLSHIFDRIDEDITENIGADEKLIDEN